MHDLQFQKEADKFRIECGYNTIEPISLKSLLQKCGVVTIFKPLSPNFSGMALKIGAGESASRYMLVNCTQSIGKQHFTICHELYHLFIQINFTSQICKTGKFDKKLDINEYYADLFASHLLLPFDGLIQNIPDDELKQKKVGLSTVVYLEQLYTCSRSALLYRLKSTKLITQEQYLEWKTNVKSSALQRGYTTDLYEAGNLDKVVGNYGNIAKQLFSTNIISESHYNSLLSDLGIDWKNIDSPSDDE